MKADNAATIAVFSAIRTGRTQRDALNAAASLALPADKLNLMRAVLSVVDSVGSERVDIAHGIWGIFDEYQDRVLWIESKHHSPWNTLVITKEMKGEYVGHDELKKNLFVVRLKDIDDVYDRMDECWKITFDLFGLLRNSDATGIYGFKGDQLFSHLCQLPPIAKALARQSLSAKA
jgi:hypothetical protein